MNNKPNPFARKDKYGNKKKKLSPLQKAALNPKINKAGLTDELIKTIVKNAAAERQMALVAEIVKRLGVMGHTFKDDAQTQQFFKDRLRIANQDGMNFVYLYDMENEKLGELIICYNEQMEAQTLKVV